MPSPFPRESTSSQILVVEDHEDGRLVLELLLTTLGYSVTGVGSCGQALAQAKQQSFDLYLLDHYLEDCVGSTLREELRLLSPDTPALYCSGIQYPAKEVEALRNSGDEFLLKPVGLATLKTTVKRLIATVHHSDRA